jgi:ABC-type transporter Mla subunit MlaD
VAATVAERRDRLAGTLRRLPGLLRAARPALADLEALGLSGTPAVADLRAAAPDATRLVEALPAFARRATPAVRDLGAAAAIGEPALRDAAPQVRRVRRLADGLQPVASMTADLFESMREKGAVEGLLRFVYYATVAQARFDSTSHVLPAQAIADGTCSLYATTTVKGCDANFAAGGRTAARKARPKRTPKRRPAPAPSRPEVPAVSPAAAVPATPAARPSVPEQVTSVVDRVLDLLRPKKDGEPQPVQPVQQVLDRLLGPGAQAEREQRDGLAGALDYLLGG